LFFFLNDINVKNFRTSLTTVVTAQINTSKTANRLSLIQLSVEKGDNTQQQIAQMWIAAII